jgi:hydrogenase small subunit
VKLRFPQQRKKILFSKSKEKTMGDKKVLTRREFLRIAGAGGIGLAGVSLFGIPGFNRLFAAAITDVPVVWIQGGGCSGCSVSILNSVSPTIQDLLLGELIPGRHVSLAFHPTVMAGQGDQVIRVLDKYSQAKPGSFVLVVEGAVSTKDDGVYCEVGEENGHGITLLEHLKRLSPRAMAVINAGTCSAFGGIPAAHPNPTGIKPVSLVLAENKINTPVVNVSGCPPHPDWFVGTVATILIGGLGALALDDYRRPKAFYGGLIHDSCQHRGDFEEGRMAEHFSEEGCLYGLGCRGPETYADCPHRKWNNGTNWCIDSGSPCIGCVEPDFPWKGSVLRQ